MLSLVVNLIVLAFEPFVLALIRVLSVVVEAGLVETVRFHPYCLRASVAISEGHVELHAMQFAWPVEIVNSDVLVVSTNCGHGV